MSDAGAAHRPPLASRRVLGQGVGAALIRADGEIDWWCPNRFEATPVLWALLDPEGGSSRWVHALAATWEHCPAGPTSRTVVHIGTNRITLWDGLVAVDGGSMLVRLVRSEAGDVPVANRLRAGGFGTPTAVWQGSPTGAFNGELEVVGGEVAIDACGDVVVDVIASADRWSGFTILAIDGTSPATTPGALEHALQDAEDRERQAMMKLRLPRRHPSRATDALHVLRALTDPMTGAPVASPTTSLPEAPGGERQFDYRYTWLRDSGLAASTAAMLGHLDAASRYIEFVGGLLDRDDGELHPLAATSGGSVPPEREVPGVAGWAGSRPVRIGNAAHDQQQLDAVAQIIDAVWVCVRSGGAMGRGTWRVVDLLAARLAEAPFAATSGVWELRVPRRLVSEEIARWHGLDRAIRLRRRYRPWRRRPGWRAARDEARQRVLRVLDPETGRLPQTFDGDGGPVDAAALTAAITGLLSRRDRRCARLVRGTIEALEQGAFVRRYPPRDDGFTGVEATFVPASWWAVTALATIGDVDAARDRADDLCVQLPPILPEEWDVEQHAPRGNLPLLWSHMEAARALYVLQREELRSKVGTVGVCVWSIARYLRVRLTRRTASRR